MFGHKSPGFFLFEGSCHDGELIETKYRRHRDSSFTKICCIEFSTVSIVLYGIWIPIFILMTRELSQLINVLMCLIMFVGSIMMRYLYSRRRMEVRPKTVFWALYFVTVIVMAASPTILRPTPNAAVKFYHSYELISFPYFLTFSVVVCFRQYAFQCFFYLISVSVIDAFCHIFINPDVSLLYGFGFKMRESSDIGLTCLVVDLTIAFALIVFTSCFERIDRLWFYSAMLVKNDMEIAEILTYCFSSMLGVNSWYWGFPKEGAVSPSAICHQDSILKLLLTGKSDIGYISGILTSKKRVSSRHLNDSRGVMVYSTGNKGASGHQTRNETFGRIFPQKSHAAGPEKDKPFANKDVFSCAKGETPNNDETIHSPQESSWVEFFNCDRACRAAQRFSLVSGDQLSLSSFYRRKKFRRRRNGMRLNFAGSGGNQKAHNNNNNIVKSVSFKEPDGRIIDQLEIHKSTENEQSVQYQNIKEQENKNKIELQELNNNHMDNSNHATVSDSQHSLLSPPLIISFQKSIQQSDLPDGEMDIQLVPSLLNSDEQQLQELEKQLPEFKKEDNLNGDERNVVDGIRIASISRSHTTTSSPFHQHKNKNMGVPDNDNILIDYDDGNDIVNKNNSFSENNSAKNCIEDYSITQRHHRNSSLSSKLFSSPPPIILMSKKDLLPSTQNQQNILTTAQEPNTKLLNVNNNLKTNNGQLLKNQTPPITSISMDCVSNSSFFGLSSRLKEIFDIQKMLQLALNQLSFIVSLSSTTNHNSSNNSNHYMNTTIAANYTNSGGSNQNISLRRKSASQSFNPHQDSIEHNAYSSHHASGVKNSSSKKSSLNDSKSAGSPQISSVLNLQSNQPEKKIYGENRTDEQSNNRDDNITSHSDLPFKKRKNKINKRHKKKRKGLDFRGFWTEEITSDSARKRIEGLIERASKEGECFQSYVSFRGMKCRVGILSLPDMVLKGQLITSPIVKYFSTFLHQFEKDPNTNKLLVGNILLFPDLKKKKRRRTKKRSSAKNDDVFTPFENYIPQSSKRMLAGYIEQQSSEDLAMQQMTLATRPLLAFLSEVFEATVSIDLTFMRIIYMSPLLTGMTGCDLTDQNMECLFDPETCAFILDTFQLYKLSKQEGRNQMDQADISNILSDRIQKGKEIILRLGAHATGTGPEVLCQIHPLPYGGGDKKAIVLIGCRGFTPIVDTKPQLNQSSSKSENYEYSQGNSDPDFKKPSIPNVMITTPGLTKRVKKLIPSNILEQM